MFLRSFSYALSFFADEMAEMAVHLVPCLSLLNGFPAVNFASSRTNSEVIEDHLGRFWYTVPCIFHKRPPLVNFATLRTISEVIDDHRGRFLWVASLRSVCFHRTQYHILRMQAFIAVTFAV